MKHVRVMPTLLLKGKGVYKTVKFKSETYIGDPINIVKILNEKEVDELVFLDIEATPLGKEPDYDLINDIASEAFMPVAYGGGIKSLKEIEQILRLGIEKVVINSSFYENSNLISSAAKVFGSQSIVVSLDVRKNFWGKYELYSKGGRQKQALGAMEAARLAQERGAGEIIVTSIDRDGTFLGYDLSLIQAVALEVTIPIVAQGGASSLEDFAAAVRMGASAVAAGSFFVFYGKHRAVLVTYPERDDFIRLLHV
jgi:cyclase